MSHVPHNLLKFLIYESVFDVQLLGVQFGPPTRTIKNSRTSPNGIHDRIHLRAFVGAIEQVAQSGR